MPDALPLINTTTTISNPTSPSSTAPPPYTNPQIPSYTTESYPAFPFTRRYWNMPRLPTRSKANFSLKSYLNVRGVNIFLVAPYFQTPDESAPHPHLMVSPAGRTMKLPCKANGQPEPQVIWKKESEEIHRDTERKTGSLYKIRRWSLEMEDASESDSGNYECEVRKY